MGLKSCFASTFLAGALFFGCYSKNYAIENPVVYQETPSSLIEESKLPVEKPHELLSVSRNYVPIVVSAKVQSSEGDSEFSFSYHFNVFNRDLKQYKLKFKTEKPECDILEKRKSLEFVLYNERLVERVCRDRFDSFVAKEYGFEEDFSQLSLPEKKDGVYKFNSFELRLLSYAARHIIHDLAKKHDELNEIDDALRTLEALGGKIRDIYKGIEEIWTAHFESIGDDISNPFSELEHSIKGRKKNSNGKIKSDIFPTFNGKKIGSDIQDIIDVLRGGEINLGIELVLELRF